MLVISFIGKSKILVVIQINNNILCSHGYKPTFAHSCTNPVSDTIDENLDLDGQSTWYSRRSEWNGRRDYGLCVSDKGT